MKKLFLCWCIFLASCIRVSAGDPNTQLVFSDSLKGKLGEGWTWLREDPKAWRHSPQGLEIRAQPGDKDTVKNALLRAAPDPAKGDYTIEVTVEYLAQPTVKYEQGGLTWYQGKKPVGKLVHEFIDGKAYAVTNWPPNKVAKEPAENPVIRLRLSVKGDGYSTQYRPGATGELQQLQLGDLKAGADEKISIQCYNGPGNAEHWMRFSDFKIFKLLSAGVRAKKRDPEVPSCRPINSKPRRSLVTSMAIISRERYP